MPIVHVPQLRTLDRWTRLQRYFRFEGRLGGLRYGARIEIHELTPPAELPAGQALAQCEDEGGQAGP